MSAITQIVGQVSGASSLLSVDSSGRALTFDATSHTKLDTLETTLTACETDLAALEVLQTSTNTKLDTLETTLTAVETDAAAIEVLITSTNTKLDTLETTNNAIQTAVEGTLSVSAPAITATNVVLENATAVADGATETTASTDLNAVRRCAVFGTHTDNTGNIQVEVSADDSNFFTNTEQTIFISSNNYYKTIDIDARYIRFKYTNGSGGSKTWTCNLSRKA